MKKIMKKIYYDEHFDINLNPITLAFDKKVYEEDFNLYFNTRELVVMKFGIVLTFIFFVLYSVLDHMVFPDLEETLLQIRIFEGVFLVLLYYFLRRYKEYSIRNLRYISSVLTLVTGIVLLKISSFYPEDNLIYMLYVAGFVLFFTAAFTVFGNRFISALLVIMIIDIGVGVILARQPEYVPFLFLQTLFISTILLSGFSAYMVEYNQRILFLEHLYSRKMEYQAQEYVKKLEKLSVTDALTGLFNRVKIEQELRRVMSEYKRYRIPACVLLIDVDHFKSVNDDHGHLEGDRVLVRVAKILRNKTRETDVVGRWGGEEFLVLTPNTRLEQAAVIGEKLRQAVEKEEFDRVGRKTVSIGLSAFEENRSIDEIIDRADQALYKAKNSGRNQVVVAGVFPPDSS